jgi:peptidoglycan hydrolase-like protein with peptidoglycan-binding domain
VARQAKGKGEGASGFAGRLVERAVENPAASGGLLVMALTASAIVVNATYLQPSDYPRPHLAPRAPAGASAPAPTVPTPRPREAAVTDPSKSSPAASTIAATPASVKPATTTVVPAKLTPEAEAALIADLQRELIRRSLYAGAIDGIVGPRTAAAIAAYQKSAGLPATGTASVELLTFMRQPAAPKPAAATAGPARGTPLPPATIPTAAAAGSVQPKPVQITSVIAEVNAADAETYRRVQLALNQMGYGLIPVDGKPGKETSDAIRRFELDYGLPVTGQPSEAVTKRLVAVGALAAR